MSNESLKWAMINIEISQKCVCGYSYFIRHANVD